MSGADMQWILSDCFLPQAVELGRLAARARMRQAATQNELMTLAIVAAMNKASAAEQKRINRILRES